MKITEKELDEIEDVAYLISEENYEGDRTKLREKIRKQILENQEFHESFYPYSNRLEEQNKRLKEELEAQSRVIKSSDEYIDNLKQKLEKFKAYNFELQRWTGDDFEWAFNQVKDKFKEILKEKK